MGWLPKPGTWLPKLIGAIVILLLLCIFLSQYFFKFIPYQQQLLNGRAFRELEQIGVGLNNKTDAYSNAIQSSLRNGSTGSATYSSFRISPPFLPTRWKKDSLYVGPIGLRNDLQDGHWQLDYGIYKYKPGSISPDADTLVCEMSTALSPVLQPIITTYKDIFSDYMILRDRMTQTPKHPFSHSDTLHNYEIVFSSGTLPVDYRVGLDSLEKNDNGFNLITIHDVTVEGTACKLFLYPLQLGKERIILAGLIESSAYKKGYNTIPFNLAIVIGVLVLLLFIHLPILKIYVLGKFERIKGFDIRLIIGTYFTTGFLVFFLFSRVFFNHVQSRSNYKHLQTLSDRVEKSLHTEIDSACRQLKHWDSARKFNQFRFDTLLSRDTSSGRVQDRKKVMEDSIDHLWMDTLFRPKTYPYADYLYWIDSFGRSITVWSPKRAFTDPAVLDVKDRTYFQDIIHHNLLTIPSTHPTTDPPDSFTIQPTLSRLDGEYNINLVMRCLQGANFKAVGFSTQTMYSVCNTLLPPGYNFSIIDLQGNILYDSRPGHALLSNIARETETPSDIIAPLRYHSDRYFDSYILQGRPRALLVSPMKGFPYALLVYYDLSGADDFQGHLIGLSAFFGAAALLLLVLSALVKEWSEKKSRILLSPIHHFEWLQPTHIKYGYYRHLFIVMMTFLLVFLGIGLFIELVARKYEFSLFFVALVFPFYIALHYYLLREKQRVGTLTNPNEESKPFAWPPKYLMVFLIAVIAAINVFASLGTRSSIFPLLFSQLVFLAVMLISLQVFTPEKSSRTPKWFNYYILTIAAGIFMINFIPAWSISWIVFRQESLVQSNTSLIVLAGSIDQRRAIVNQRISNYKLAFGNHADSSQHSRDKSDLHNLKFQYGLYFTGEDTVVTAGSGDTLDYYPIASSYTQIHRWLFRSDSTALVWPANPNHSSDSSWAFHRGGKGSWAGPELLFNNLRDAIDNDPIVMPTDSTASYSAARLMLHEIFTTASPFYVLYYIGCILLILSLLHLLTRSLARRIFVLHILDEKSLEISRVAGIPVADRLFRAQRKIGLPETIDQVNDEEMVWWENPMANEKKILDNVDRLEEFYYAVWKPLSDIEKFILYDFAIDSFTNYKNNITVTGLINNHILRIVDNETLAFMTPGFREWILRTRDKVAFDKMSEKIRRTGTWENIKRPLLLLLAIPGVFIFVTQDDILQKVTGFLTALTPILSFLSSLFPKKEDNKG